MREETFVVAQRGVGKPDYSRKVSSSLERAGIKLGYNQSLKVFGRVFTAVPSPYDWVSGVLAPGATVSIYDFETGVVTPWTLPAGYILSLVTEAWSFNEDSSLWLHLDGFPVACFGYQEAGKPYYTNRVLPLSSTLIDPTGALAHTFDFQVTNNGLGDLSGGVDIMAILEPVGTKPLPNTKVVRCKFCGNEKTVPRDSSAVICDACGKLFIVYNLSRFRGTS